MLGSNSVRHIAKMAERYLVVASSEADQARMGDKEIVLRPCIVKDSAGVHEPVMQWFGLFYDQGQLISVITYDKIPDKALTTRNNDERPLGLNGLTDDDGNLRPDALTKRDPHAYSPYILYRHTISKLDKHVLRLLASKEYFQRVFDAMSDVLTGEKNGENTMEAFLHQHNSFQTKTCSVESANNRVTFNLPCATALLRTGGLRYEILQVIKDCDAGRVVDPKTWGNRNNQKKPIQKLDQEKITVYVGSEKECNDTASGARSYRWLHEDWPRSEGKSPSSGMHAVEIDPFNDDGRFQAYVSKEEDAVKLKASTEKFRELVEHETHMEKLNLGTMTTEEDNLAYATAIGGGQASNRDNLLKGRAEGRKGPIPANERVSLTSFPLVSQMEDLEADAALASRWAQTCHEWEGTQ